MPASLALSDSIARHSSLRADAKCNNGNTTLELSQKRYFNTPEAFNAPNDQLADSHLC